MFKLSINIKESRRTLNKYLRTRRSLKSLIVIPFKRYLLSIRNINVANALKILIVPIFLFKIIKYHDLRRFRAIANWTTFRRDKTRRCRLHLTSCHRD